MAYRDEHLQSACRLDQLERAHARLEGELAAARQTLADLRTLERRRGAAVARAFRAVDRAYVRLSGGTLATVVLVVMAITLLGHSVSVGRTYAASREGFRQDVIASELRRHAPLLERRCLAGNAMGLDAALKVRVGRDGDVKEATVRTRPRGRDEESLVRNECLEGALHMMRLPAGARELTVDLDLPLAERRLEERVR